MVKGDGDDHMVCTESGRGIAFHYPENHKRKEQIARENGFEVIGHSLELYVKPLKQD